MICPKLQRILTWKWKSWFSPNNIMRKNIKSTSHYLWAEECDANDAYKLAFVQATAGDLVIIDSCEVMGRIGRLRIKKILGH